MIMVQVTGVFRMSVHAGSLNIPFYEIGAPQAADALKDHVH